jgi:hypothetical protein
VPCSNLGDIVCPGSRFLWFLLVPGISRLCHNRFLPNPFQYIRCCTVAIRKASAKNNSLPENTAMFEQWKRDYCCATKETEPKLCHNACGFFHSRIRQITSSIQGLGRWAVPGFDSRQCQEFSLLHSVPTDSGAHPASYPMGTGGSLPGDKVAGA